MSTLSQLRSRSAAVVASALVLTAGIQLSQALAAPQAPQSPVTVTREPLASAGHPRGADHRTLGLSRVTIMPGSKLALHHHPDRLPLAPQQLHNRVADPARSPSRARDQIHGVNLAADG